GSPFAEPTYARRGPDTRVPAPSVSPVSDASTPRGGGHVLAACRGRRDVLAARPGPANRRRRSSAPDRAHEPAAPAPEAAPRSGDTAAGPLVAQQLPEPGCDGHDREGRICGTLRRQAAAAGHEEVLEPPDLVSRVADGALGREAHAAAADEMGVAVD